ncbi:hypothetical protein [Bradyrhizobium sp. SZCCHNS3004]|uniref:hypothetical protein n=1 Tax=Bradyrhizobium sp. SZCCHNS3004 TaxID=3057312 RepID=UPI002916F08A|nr:hypothetical protein [Bradyrhizobium sp. SZCCHNS3004]
MIFARSNLVRGPADGDYANWCDDIVKSSPIKHAKYQSFASVIGFQSIAPFVSDVRSIDRLGLVVTGSAQHVGVAWRFAERAFQAGPSMVNPISFPATLTSAVPASIAAAVGAHAFALTIGYDDRALFEAIDRSCLMIRHDHADDVFVVACADRSPHPIESWHSTQGVRAEDAAVGLHLSRFRSTGSCALRSSGHDEDNVLGRSPGRLCDERGILLWEAMQVLQTQADTVSIYSPDSTYRIDLTNAEGS